MYRENKQIMTEKSYKIVFATYMILLVLTVLLKFDGSFERILSLRERIIQYETLYNIRNMNLVPFRNISSYLGSITESYAFINIVGSTIAFIPLGYLVSIIFSNNKLGGTLVTSFAIILVIEILQFVLKIGFFDIDDIMLSLVGVLIGYGISVISKRLKTKSIDNPKQLNLS
ncbi:MAG: hypothetical protein ATN35_09675 [Epulopiscium sp. Nele67-Bin004]|nr:MAG: hypothetical protein ATN35_09675 [Epulopiscium sp. Nele67-Bin004]